MDFRLARRVIFLIQQRVRDFEFGQVDSILGIEQPELNLFTGQWHNETPVSLHSAKQDRQLFWIRVPDNLLHRVNHSGHEGDVDASDWPLFSRRIGVAKDGYTVTESYCDRCTRVKPSV